MSSFIIIDKILSKGNLEVISSSLKFQNRLLPKLTTCVFLFLFKREKRRYHDDMNGAFKFLIIGALEILSSNTSLKYLFATNYPLLKINHQRIFIFLSKLFHIQEYMFSSRNQILYNLAINIDELDLNPDSVFSRLIRIRTIIKNNIYYNLSYLFIYIPIYLYIFIPSI